MAGSVTQSVTQTRNGDLRVWCVNLEWVGDSANGTIPSTAIESSIMAKVQGLYLFRARTIPGAGTAPTTLYDIVVNDADSVDVMGGTLANRSATVTETIVPLQDVTANLYGPVYCGTALTMVISNQAVHSATGTLRLYFSA